MRRVNSSFLSEAARRASHSPRRFWLRVPAEPVLGRIYGAIAVAATYILLRRIVSRIAMEYLPR